MNMYIFVFEITHVQLFRQWKLKWEFYLQCDVINGNFLLKGTALKNLVLVTSTN